MDVYTVLSTFRNRAAEAIRVASPGKFIPDIEFVKKLYGFVPLGEKSCAGNTLFQILVGTLKVVRI